ncbi:MAG: class I SAM-dependent methyltransferase [Calditrichaeota bacterium]|nr:class I SAM-dependent methyltransferase [Candidatus Cloacimonadota bacterium]MCA9785653.1 class I SAM-dependent methyltransferase [Candidatus Cloacimonadota bacterium]MCB1046370.1 class I SAM-dependent methyltransferase [Calditrichota bacterium]MCB9474304.1 class I SAM-dependent methyltransferase [Candidatus Delongbacteria bacterium]
MSPPVPMPITFQPNIYGKVQNLLPEGAGRRALDVGAGHGHFSHKLQERGYQVDACDFLPELFQCPTIPFRRANLNESLPYEDNQFDLVVSIEVVEHIENHFTFMSELLRVARPGAVIIVTTPNVLSLSSRWHHFLYGYCDCAPVPLDPGMEAYFMQHINPISLPQLIFHAERFGGEVVGVATNRYRKGSLLFMPILYPLLALSLRRKLLGRKYREKEGLHRRHLRWMCTRANLLGRITILQVRKRDLS